MDNEAVVWRMELGPLAQGVRQGEVLFVCGQQLGEMGEAARIEGPELPVGVAFADAAGRDMLRVLAAARLPVAGGAPVAGHWVEALGDLEACCGRLSLAGRRQGVTLARITLSDKGARGEREDKAGPAIESVLKEHLDLGLTQAFLIPDNARALKALLMDLALTQRFDMVVTTGGTGLAPSDHTPEATLAVIEKRLPGFEQAMIATSLAKTPHGALSRAVAGTLGPSLIINLPGSPRAVQENLAAVAPALKHALDKLQGDPTDCAVLLAPDRG